MGLENRNRKKLHCVPGLGLVDRRQKGGCAICEAFSVTNGSRGCQVSIVSSWRIGDSKNVGASAQNADSARCGSTGLNRRSGRTERKMTGTTILRFVIW